MAVIDQTDPYESELAKAWLAPREQVLGSTERRFRRLGSGAVAAAVDQAWLELYERCQEPPDPETLRRRWQKLSDFRASDRLRDLERQRVHSSPVDELEDYVLLDKDAGILESARSQARLEEILSQTAGESQLWLEALLETPAAPPRVLAARLEWEVEKVRTVARRTRVQLRAFLAARDSGVICERRQAVLTAFAVTHLRATSNPGSSANGEVLPTLSAERYKEVALHIAGCLDCERAWHRERRRMSSRLRLALLPPLLGKAAAAGGSLWTTGRRLLFHFRVRAESGVGRATARGAAGTAGTAGVLAGKGAATICAGLVCASGLGASALVVLPVAALQHAHSHHRSIERDAASRRSVGARTTSAGAVTTAPYKNIQRTASAQPSSSTSHTNTSHTSSHTTSRPTTLGDMSTASSSTEHSDASVQARVIAKSASTSTRSEYSSSSSRRTANHGSGSPCVLGTLGC
jgi:hypothetical protein